MYCGKCGLKLSKNEIKCPRCGTFVPGAITPELVAAEDSVMPPEVVMPPDVRQQAPRPQRNIGRLVIVIALAVLVVGGAGFLIGLLIYHNSDGYKTGQAVTAIMDGNLDKGLDNIADVVTPEADAIRQFCEIEKQRSAFFDNYSKDTLQGFDSPVKVSYDKLLEAYNTFGTSDDLPEKLKNRYNSYNTRLGDMNKVMSAISTRTLTDAQRGVLAFGERKRGANFTVNELRKVVEQTEPSVSVLQSEVANSAAYASFAEKNDAAAVKAMNDFCQVAIERLAQDQFDLSNYELRFDPTKPVLLSDKNESYVASMSSLLKPLSSLSDAQANAQLLYTALCYAWAAYVFE